MTIVWRPSEAYLERAVFDERLERLIADVVGAPPIDPSRPVLLPGEAEQEQAVRRLRVGIPVDRDNFTKLQELARDVGVPFTLEPVDGERAVAATRTGSE